MRPIFALPQFAATSPFAQYAQFIQVAQVGANTEVRIDADGSGAGTAFTTLAVLQGVASAGLRAQNFKLV
ncbi:MAG: hypothetical protein OHK0037_03080 [Elainellaceae cyanobacterium]